MTLCPGFFAIGAGAAYIIEPRYRRSDGGNAADVPGLRKNFNFWRHDFSPPVGIMGIYTERKNGIWSCAAALTPVFAVLYGVWLFVGPEL